MTPSPLTIAVCVPTYNRPAELERCLNSIASQTLRDRGDNKISVIVGDNNEDGSAVEYVRRIAPSYPFPVTAIHVKKPGLCEVRNALFNATQGRFSYLALIDDDEWAEPDWLEALVTTIQMTGAQAVVGPVMTFYPEHAPRWLISSGMGQFNAKFLKLPAGAPSPKLGTSNALIRAEVLSSLEQPFFPLELNFVGSEDRAFFWRMQAKEAGRIVWCPTAVVSENVPAERTTVRFFVRRGIQRGVSEVLAWRAVKRLHPSFGEGSGSPIQTLQLSAKVLIALPAILFGSYRYRYMRFAIYCAGRILGHLGFESRLYRR